jgi:hypothetical protein
VPTRTVILDVRQNVIFTFYFRIKMNILRAGHVLVGREGNRIQSDFILVLIIPARIRCFKSVGNFLVKSDR